MKIKLRGFFTALVLGLALATVTVPLSSQAAFAYSGSGDENHDYSPIADPGDTNTVPPWGPSSGSPEPDYSQPLGDECWDYCYGAY